MLANVFAVLDLRHPHGFSVSRHPSITRETVELCLRQRNSKPVGHVLPAGPFKKIQTPSNKQTSLCLLYQRIGHCLLVDICLRFHVMNRLFQLLEHQIPHWYTCWTYASWTRQKNTNRTCNKNQRLIATTLRTVPSADGPRSSISFNWMIRSLAKMAASIRTPDSACGKMSPSIVSCPSVN